jgi:hypothetical protein
MAQHRVGVDETPTIINDGPDFTKEQTLDSETTSNTKAETAPPLENVANGANGLRNEHALEKPGTYDKVEITEDDCYDELGFSFPSWKKWMILTIIFLVQVLQVNFFGHRHHSGFLCRQIDALDGGVDDLFDVARKAAGASIRTPLSEKNG